MSSDKQSDKGIIDTGHAEGEPSYLTSKKGMMSWLITVDHKRIGLMYLSATMFFFLVAGLLAISLRTELFTGAQDFSNETYNQVFTLHGAFMTFLVMSPAIPGLARQHGRCR